MTTPAQAATVAIIAAQKKPKASRYDIIRAGTDAAHEVMGYKDRLKAWAIACEVFEGMK